MSAPRRAEVARARLHLSWAVHEALDAVLAPQVRAAVLEHAGWSEELGRPTDPSIDLLRWVDARLFPQLVDHMTLTYADELRRQLRALLERTIMGPPIIRRPQVLESGSGPVFRLEGNTRVLSGAGVTLIAWADEFTARDLVTLLPPKTQIVIVKNVIELTLTLASVESEVSVVLLDRREIDVELESTVAHHLADQRILVWGPESLDTPEWRPLLGRTERTIGCSTETNIDEVAGLCTRLLRATPP